MGTGMVMACVAMLGLRLFTIDSPYSQIWPFYAILGAGIALTMPAMSAAAMGAIDPRKAGVGSGVLNAARQVGGAMGIAVLGSVSAAITVKTWTEETQGRGGIIAVKPDQLRQLVEGAQSRLLNELAGPAIMRLGQEAWMTGFHASVVAGAGLMGAAVVAVIIGFRGVQKPQALDSSDPPPPVVFKA